MRKFSKEHAFVMELVYLPHLNKIILMARKWISLIQE